MNTLGVALIGCGGIALQNHLPGLALLPDVKVVSLCDSNPQVLEKARAASGIEACCQDYQEVLQRDDVHAVIIATPNDLHAPLALAAIKAGKHVCTEKPMALNLAEALQMYQAAEVADVRHMTAFTYRFVPAMRYMAHLVQQGAIGRPYHFRSCRLQDWGQRAIGWRQIKKHAGTGELGDMLSHRIDYAHMLIGPISHLGAATRRFLDEREGQPSDLEDWVAILAEFSNQASGVLESTKLATGRGEGVSSQDYVELNGSEGSLVFQIEDPWRLQVARKGDTRATTVELPPEFLKVPGSPRDPHQGDPMFTFRYDQNFEFIDAIRNQRPCSPSFLDGARAQAVMDTAIQAAESRAWQEVPKLS